MKSIVKIFLILYLFAITYPIKSYKNKNVLRFYNSLSNTNNKYKTGLELESESSTNTDTENFEFGKLKSKFKKNKKNNSIKHHKKSHSLNSILDNLNLEDIEKAKEKEKEKENQNQNKNQYNDNEDIKFLSLYEQNLNYTYTGWQAISSELFKNEVLFPKVRVLHQLGKYKEEGIFYSSNFTRINYKKNSNRTRYEFLFRMTNDFLAYTTDETDINYLQVFYIENIINVVELPILVLIDHTELSCFNIVERETKFQYKICSSNREENLKLMCTLGKRLNIHLDSCIYPEGDIIETKTIINQTIIDATIVIPLPSKECNDKWNYGNHGDDWECLCKTGNSQSPIDLPDLDKVIQSPIVPFFQFEEVSAKSPVTTVDGEYIEGGNIKIKYLNGALRVLHPNLGKVVTLNGSQYIGEEITVHTPSEHTREGKRYDMEIQITFYGVTKGDIAKQVVLSFLFEKKPGYYNKFIDDLDFYSLPNQVDTEKFILNNLYIPKIFYSVTGGESSDEFTTMKCFSFYTYEGSLTMPPCSENTIHYVASEIIPIGSVVLDLAKEALRMPDMKKEESNVQTTIITDNSTVENYRNTQEKNFRNIFYFDHKKYTSQKIDFTVPKKPNYHYEKIKKDVFYHIYVPGSHPSGIPGSFVESENEALGILSKKNESEKENF
jgi:carbonic anhydrase